MTLEERRIIELLLAENKVFIFDSNLREFYTMYNTLLKGLMIESYTDNTQ